MTVPPRLPQALARRATDIPEAATLVMAAKARALREAGKDVVNLTIGEPGFDTPQEIKEAATRAMAAGHTKYSPVGGIAELRQAVASKLKHDNALTYAPGEIVICNGAKQAITNICMSFLNPGDEAIVIAPYWVAYTGAIAFAGGVPVVVETSAKNGFRLDLAALEASVTPKTKLIFLNSPSNPSGAVYTREELEGVIAIARKCPDLWILSDEIYEGITFDGSHLSTAAVPGGHERTITVNGVSKSFAMTGWRIGYCAAPQPVAGILAKVQGILTAGANPFVQHAAAFAIEHMQQATRDMATAYRQRRDIVVELLRAIPDVRIDPPAGAFYAFADVSAYFGKSRGNRRIEGSLDLAEYLLEDALVSTVPGIGFGDDHCLRLSFASSEDDLRNGIKRITEALGRLS